MVNESQEIRDFINSSRRQDIKETRIRCFLDGHQPYGNRRCACGWIDINEDPLIKKFVNAPRDNCNKQVRIQCHVEGHHAFTAQPQGFTKIEMSCKCGWLDFLARGGLGE